MRHACRRANRPLAQTADRVRRVALLLSNADVATDGKLHILGAMAQFQRERIHERQFRGAGIAEHDLDAFLLEQVKESALSGHHGQSILHR